MSGKNINESVEPARLVKPNSIPIPPKNSNNVQSSGQPIKSVGANSIPIPPKKG